ncbi:hypothetical protein N9B31_09985 [Mariniblastus sp.]|nr:hypothetical protein [Mariniblastus sp.]MDA7903978.1 hypothetical protein [Mariniblastus sp.]
MQRTFNYTGRKRVEQKHAQFHFEEPRLNVPVFNVQWNLDPADYNPAAKLYVEARHKETRKRFDFGTVGKIAPPVDRRLDGIDLSGPTLFDVLIVDESGQHGLLVASGREFRADGDDDKNRTSMLSVRKEAIGQLTWKVNFESGDLPELCISNQIANGIEKMRTDPHFQALVFPAALREILMFYLWDNTDEDDPGFQRWMAFASIYTDTKPDAGDPVDAIAWIDDVVTGFSESFKLTDMLVNIDRED